MLFIGSLSSGSEACECVFAILQNTLRDNREFYHLWL